MRLKLYLGKQQQSLMLARREYVWYFVGETVTLFLSELRQKYAADFFAITLSWSQSGHV